MTHLFLEYVEAGQSIEGRHLHPEGVPGLTFGVLGQLFQQSGHCHTAEDKP